MNQKILTNMDGFNILFKASIILDTEIAIAQQNGNGKKAAKIIQARNLIDELAEERFGDINE